MIAVMLLLWHLTSVAQWVVYIIIRNVDDIETKVRSSCLRNLIITILTTRSA